MKLLNILLLLIIHGLLAGQVGVNVLNPHPSAALQVNSPSSLQKGLLSPTMSTTGRMSMTTGTLTMADGLIVYDISHHLPYYYNALSNRWQSMSPFVLSTPTVASNNYPSGFITTPVSTVATTYSVGINKLSPTRELDVAGSASVSGAMDVGGNAVLHGSLSVTGYPVNALVPSGCIVMWHGSSIPAGWVMCDGNNGTPDLRGRFIVGAGQAATTSTPGDTNPNYAVNSTGGVNQQTLNASEIPKHTHQMNGDNSTVGVNGGSHFHYANPTGQGTGLARASGNNGGVAGDGTQTIATDYATHSHPTSEFSGHTGDGSTSGLSGLGHENRPAFYALIFIMKL